MNVRNVKKSYGFAIALVFAIYISLALLYGRIIIEGDGVSYYALTLSLIRDGDFDLQNQKQQMTGIMAPFHPVTNRQASLFSCGFPILYSPFVLISEKVADWWPALSNWQPYPQNKWIPFAHSLGIFIASALFGLASLFLAFRLVSKKYIQSSILAAVISLAVFAGTPLLFYSLATPSYAHAADAFLVSVIFFLVFCGKPAQEWKAHVRNILIGIALSLSVSLRNNNIVLVLPSLLGLLYMERGHGLRRSVVILLGIAAGALPMLIVLANFNLSQYGSVITTGYKIQTESSFLLEMLFHPFAGLFLWAPITLLALIGLIIGSIKRHPEDMISLLSVALVLLSVQFQPNWWGGCSFGQRFLTHLFLFWVIGLARIFHYGKLWTILSSSVCVIWTFLLFNLYFVNFSTDTGRQMLHNNKCRHTAVDMIKQASAEYRFARVINDSSGIIDFWSSSLCAPPFPTLHCLKLENRKHIMHSNK